MTIRNLDRMFEPASVALIGASEESASVGLTTARNLLGGGFGGRISFVNPRRTSILGTECYESVPALPDTPDLAIIATPRPAVPDVIAALVHKGTRAAVVITAGLGSVVPSLLDAARPSCLRLLGPNCLGLMLPRLGLNASFAHRAALAGDLAFISQSGALLTSIIDWASARRIGFSHIISLGDMIDVDFGDLLDYLSGEPACRAILLYMEAVTSAPKFLSAARRAARVKPVIVVKSGRHEGGARAALSHTGALAGADAAYEAAFRRTGLLRVKTLHELFAAAEILSRAPRLSGERLTILTNGGGAGVLAADELQDAGGTLAALAPETVAALNTVLPSTWSHGNPVDIIGDAGAERYSAALSALLQDRASDAVLVMQCPTAITSPTDAARAVINAVKRMTAASAPKKLVLTSWLGEDAPREARALFSANGIASFETPSEAIGGFMQIVRHGRAQRELVSTPPAARAEARPDAAAVARQIGDALKGGQNAVSPVSAKLILKSYGIPVAETLVAADPSEVAAHAEALLANNRACVVKILSRDITHKSDVGGVRLGLETPAAAGQAALEMIARVRQVRPGAAIDGFMVEPMVRRPHAQEVIIGMSVDETFGPMILFGAGGTAVEVIQDSGLALPPLDLLLARQLIAETRISRLLAGYRDHPPADLDALAAALVATSELIVRHPEIRELDINPLLADERGIIALDARMRIADEAASPRRPLSIKAYPSEWEIRLEIAELGTVNVRPVKPEDATRYHEFFSHISRDDMRLRFFTSKRDAAPELLARLTQIDYAREMAFVALDARSERLLGVVRVALDPDMVRGEFGILIRSDLKGRGLGWQLMNRIIAYARAEGIAELVGLVLAENVTMLEMSRELGFEIRALPGDVTVREVRLALGPSARERALKR